MKILQFIVISIAFLLMILVESSFSVDTNEDNNISKLTLLQKIDDVIKAEESLGKNQEKIQELKKAREQYQQTLLYIELMKNRITVLKEQIEAQNNYHNSVSVNNKLRDSHSIYTIQTGSFIKIERAQKQFDLIVKGLNEKELDYLRIEKIGKFYGVRLGKFIKNAEAKIKLESVKSYMPNCTIVKTRYMEERIENIYTPQKSSRSG